MKILLQGLLYSVLIISSIACKNEVKETTVQGEQGTQPVFPCDSTDTNSPVFNPPITITSKGSTINTPVFEWVSATDQCSLSHYELAIGVIGNIESVLTFTNIGSVTTYTHSGISLSFGTDYYTSIRAVDQNGNTSALVTNDPWTIFTPQSLTNIILWQDSADLSSITDVSGNNPSISGPSSFDGNIANWADISGSSVVHDFSTTSDFPQWDPSENAVEFNGSDGLLVTANTNDINLDIVGQRTLSLALKTSNDISSRQVLFEEGGNLRGINIYIYDNKLYCGFWNLPDDGDGVQPFIGLSQTITAETSYIVHFVYDYSNFTGASGADGSVECFINGSSIGSEVTSSRLHDHGGNIGLGAMNDSSYFHDGSATLGDTFFYRGHIYEFIIYNTAHNSSDLDELY
jgi:hypothetical protein